MSFSKRSLIATILALKLGVLRAYERAAIFESILIKFFECLNEFGLFSILKAKNRQVIDKLTTLPTASSKSSKEATNHNKRRVLAECLERQLDLLALHSCIYVRRTCTYCILCDISRLYNYKEAS